MELQALEMRLENLEKKMGEVHELTSILPRLEERMIAQKDDLQDHEFRLRKLEENQQKGNVYIGWVERFAWAVIVVIAGSSLIF
jgi:hypothetical protein